MSREYKPQENTYRRKNTTISDKKRAYNIQYYKKNREKILKQCEEHRKLNREQAKAYAKEYRKQFSGYQYVKRHRELLRDYLISIKDGATCLDCGYQYPHFMLDFDHVRGKKEFAISSCLLKTMSLERVMNEIKKCELVCSNCHRIRTYTRRQNNAKAKKRKVPVRKIMPKAL